MADFNSRFDVSNTMKPDDESFLRRTLTHKAFDMRIDNSFPSQGTPQGSHEGSQSDTPSKDNP